ncbi:MAG: hypothetical protein IH583_05915 [Candidatus Aminicenantes bacterium]|nr:hypothetical protein [Candidatus Aminicenantes bacterium]
MAFKPGVNMFSNYLKIALRNFKQHKGYSSLNVAGPAALVISWLTVALQTLKSARTNPVDALHFE